jgi:histidine triad (HIT) family protein
MPFRLAPYRSCPFCAYISGEVECAVIAETELALAIVNKTQYERGAALVLPKQHRETILDITPTEIASVYTLAKRIAVAGEAAFGAIGANVFQNNGIKAGQHVPHMHVHVVPRYEASDPEKLFLQRDFAIVELAELKAIAATIRAAL